MNARKGNSLRHGQAVPPPRQGGKGCICAVGGSPIIARSPKGVLSEEAVAVGRLKEFSRILNSLRHAYACHLPRQGGKGYICAVGGHIALPLVDPDALHRPTGSTAGFALRSG